MTTIRPANFVDIPLIVDLARDALARSRFAAFANLDIMKVKANCIDCIHAQRPAPPEVGGPALFVAERDGRLDGCFLGTVTPLYFGTDAMVGSNVFFYVRHDALPSTAFRLLRAFEAWARAAPDLAMFRYGFSDAIGDPAQTARLFEATGCRQVGFIYEKENT